MREKIKLKTFCLHLHRQQLVLNAREALMGLKKKFAKFSFSKKKKTETMFSMFVASFSKNLRVLS